MKPVILCFGGHDPGGGAGVAADIEAIFQTGSKAMPVITAITSQNTQGVYGVKPVSAKWILKQTEPLLADFKISAIKIGMCATKDAINAIEQAIKLLPDLPMVLDPVVKSGSGDALADEDLSGEIRNKLLPLTSIVTPNMAELRYLSKTEKLFEKIYDIQNLGCENLLVTNTDESNDKANIEHLFFFGSRQLSFNYPKLNGIYHGSGCTLAASLASFLAQGNSMQAAVKMALEYTWRTLEQSSVAGNRQMLPERMV